MYKVQLDSRTKRFLSKREGKGVKPLKRTLEHLVIPHLGSLKKRNFFILAIWKLEGFLPLKISPALAVHQNVPEKPRYSKLHLSISANRIYPHGSNRFSNTLIKTYTDTKIQLTYRFLQKTLLPNYFYKEQ